ncbi:glucose-6-phosphate isomerase [Candidatus Saccharibacteria bacterium]|nr:glucose-6-phosphate isomerase [Candidatus Saccharibacteria bacterium]
MKLIGKYLDGFISQQQIDKIKPKVIRAHAALLNGTGAGADYLGWVNLPKNYDKTEFARIKQLARKIQTDSDILIVIGVGGSYLGARAVIEALKTNLYNDLPKNTPNVYFAGNSLSSVDLSNLLKLCEGKDVSLNVVSKSGTTLEPAVAFRVLKQMMEQKYGVSQAAKRIYVTTDSKKGALKAISDKNGYETLVVPNNIGGRYSVLTAVGLLPIAVADVNISQLMAGAAKARTDMKLPDNPASRYAVYRNLLYNQGYITEILVNFEPSLAQFGQWFGQLFAESEGKDGKGLLPNDAIFTTDLHSIGQYLQDGKCKLFETVVRVKNSPVEILVPAVDDNLDGLNFLDNQPVAFLNDSARRGALRAHNEGGVPNIVLELPALDEFNLGYLIYFFEFACAISGYLLGVNPFDQPGVEAYKHNMYQLIHTPGHK